MQLLERTSFLETLAHYGTDATQGNGRLVLISGESGMGKTVLIEAFQQRTANARWLWGACDGIRTPRPLGPLFDIGMQAGGELAELCRRDATRDQLFAAFLAEADTPATLTVAVIEDVHWADEATIDLLNVLGRRLGRMRALLLATYRDDELADDHPLRVVLGDLATQRATRRMRLPPLSEAAVRDLVGERDVDAAELHRITGGNPFFVTEILEAGWPAVPPTVRDTVAARLTRSGPASRQVIESAAVIGARVDQALLSSVLPDTAPVDESLTSGILVSDDGELRFRHELVRMAVEAGIAPRRKAELHGLVLAELEVRGNADPALLAHHAEGAGDEKAVLRHAPEAARRAAALGAHREAAAQFERALRFSADIDATVLAALHEGLAGEYSLLDRWEETEEAVRAALVRRRELGDDRSIGLDLQMLATTLWRLCRGEESHAAAQEAVLALEVLPPGPELGFAYAKLGMAQWSIGRAEGLELIEKARDLGERLQHADLVSYALNAIGLGMAKRRGEDALPTLEQALRTGLDAGLQEAAGRAYSSLHEAAVSLQEFDAADRYYAEGMAYCEDRELGVFSMCLEGWRTVAQLQKGQWDEAERICGQMLHRPGISPVNQLNALTTLGSIRGRRGEAGAWDLLDEAAALGEATIEPQWIVPVRAARAEMRWLSGDHERAAQEARSGYDQGFGRVHPWMLGSVAIWIARLRTPAFGGSGQSADGGASLARDSALRASDSAALPEPYSLELAGDLAGAAAAWDSIGRSYDAALVRLGSADEADLRQALSVFDDLGASTAASAARRRMKSLGIGAVPRGPRAATKATPAGLTPREREVLTLLTEGLSDREISRRLFISERTVHHHVSAVLAKIGVSSRTAAVREAARMGIGSPI
jgi:DNA-binding CsgD family transcriptional regulator/tetratricopeptide (TPR) repeat protein